METPESAVETATQAAKKAAAQPGKVSKAKKILPKPKTAAETPAPTVGAHTETGPNMPGALRKRGLIGAVTERAGIKRRDAKAAVEAALEILGEAIAEGRAMNLPGLGKVKVMRTKEQPNAKVFVTKVRQPMARDVSAPETDPDTPPKDPLAEAAE
ncbi:HU family DNA-binding protein [Marimonas arenosa]|uniref:HU family DNA-binding protein n=2 Tax=Marimonas arenosa TaxID=1795305 RepID=A0AAE4B2L1_9RHOB|nr:HU family DNA-binding protein [Marimonas arenosa]